MGSEFSIGREPKGVRGLKVGTEDTPFGKGDVLIVKGLKHIGDVAWPGNWSVVDAEKHARRVKDQIENQGHQCLWVHINVEYELIWSPWPVNRITVTEDFAIYGLHDQVSAGVLIAIVVISIVGMYLYYRTMSPVIWHAEGISPEEAKGYGDATSISSILGDLVAVIIGIIVLVIVLMSAVVASPYLRKLFKSKEENETTRRTIR